MEKLVAELKARKLPEAAKIAYLQCPPSPTASRWNVVKYASLVSLLRTGEPEPVLIRPTCAPASGGMHSGCDLLCVVRWHVLFLLCLAVFCAGPATGRWGAHAPARGLHHPSGAPSGTRP